MHMYQVVQLLDDFVRETSGEHVLGAAADAWALVLRFPEGVVQAGDRIAPASSSSSSSRPVVLGEKRCSVHKGIV
jgi:hypothetical protein